MTELYFATRFLNTQNTLLNLHQTFEEWKPYIKATAETDKLYLTIFKDKSVSMQIFDKTNTNEHNTIEGSTYSLFLLAVLQFGAEFFPPIIKHFHELLNEHPHIGYLLTGELE